MLLQKEYIESPLTHKRKKNRGELPQYLIENSHEPIIDKATFDYVQEEMARRKELGPLANKSLNTSCFTGKIKCPSCGLSYMHSLRRDKGFQEFWYCGSRKKKGGQCDIGGTINHKNLKKVCADVMELNDFDETAFLENVDFINVPKKYVLEFHMKDGRIITKDCPNTGHRDCWTEEYRAITSAKRRQNPTCRKSSVMTGKIKCVRCGCNFRNQIDKGNGVNGQKYRYWRCAEHNGCDTIGIRDDRLQIMMADVLGITEFDEAVFKEQIDHIDVLSATEMAIYFKDGKRVSRIWEQPKREGKPWTDEHRAKFMESITRRKNQKGAKVWHKEE